MGSNPIRVIFGGGSTASNSTQLIFTGLWHRRLASYFISLYMFIVRGVQGLWDSGRSIDSHFRRLASRVINEPWHDHPGMA